MAQIVQPDTSEQVSWGEAVTVVVQAKTLPFHFINASALVRSCLNGCLGAAKHLIGRCRAEVDALVSCCVLHVVVIPATFGSRLL